MLYFSVIIVFLLIFTWITCQNLKTGIFLLTALLPAYLIRFAIFGLPATLLEAMIWLLFIIWLIKLKRDKNLSFNPWQWIKNIAKAKLSIYDQNNPIPFWLRWPILLLLLAATISVFIAPDLRTAAGLWKAYFIEPLLYLIVLVYTFKSSQNIKNLIRALGLTVLCIGIFAIIQKLTGGLIDNPFWANETTRRITTFFGYPNANALFIVPIIFLTLGNLLTDKSNTFSQNIRPCEKNFCKGIKKMLDKKFKIYIFKYLILNS